MVLGCSKWLGVRLELLCSLLVTLVAAGAVLITQIPGTITKDKLHSFISLKDRLQLKIMSDLQVKGAVSRYLSIFVTS